MYLPLSLTCKKQDDLHEETDCKINDKKQNNFSNFSCMFLNQQFFLTVDQNNFGNKIPYFFTFKLHKRQNEQMFISIDRI